MSQSTSSAEQRSFFGWLVDNQDPSNDEVAEVRSVKFITFFENDGYMPFACPCGSA